MIRSLITRHEETRSGIVASHYANTLGVPALFDRACFAELLSLPADCGAKLLIEHDPARVAQIEFPDGAFDLDTPADVQALSGQAK